MKLGYFTSSTLKTTRELPEPTHWLVRRRKEYGFQLDEWYFPSVAHTEGFRNMGLRNKACKDKMMVDTQTNRSVV